MPFIGPHGDLRQALSDYLNTAARELQKIPGRQLERLQLLEQTWMQCVLSGRSDGEYEKQLSQYESEYPAVQATRKNNREVVAVLDRMLAVMGVNLKRFMPKSRISRLLQGESRRVVTMSTFHGEQRRSIVRDAAGNDKMGLPRRYVDGHLDELVLHMCLEPGRCRPTGCTVDVRWFGFKGNTESES